MKAGFKPKKMTKKEWQDNRDMVCKGSGVGKALDAWQKNCPDDFNGATADIVKKATAANKALLDALVVAEKKCDKTRHKDMIAGISKYRLVATNYGKCIDDAAKKVQARDKFTTSVNSVAAIRKENGLEKIYLQWAKGPGRCLPEAHGYILLEDNKLADFYRLYASKRKVNVPGYAQSALEAKFGRGENVDAQELKSARSGSMGDIHQMLRARIRDFCGSDMFADFMARKFLVPTFTY